jgi:hypothetical protein
MKKAIKDYLFQLCGGKELKLIHHSGERVEKISIHFCPFCGTIIECK